MYTHFTRQEDEQTIDIAVDYDLIEVAPDMMTPTMVYLFFKPKESIESFTDFLKHNAFACLLQTMDGMGYTVGFRYVQGWVEAYFYTARSKALRHHIDTLIPQGLQYEMGANKDEKWRLYFKQLLPSDVEKMHINNQAVLDELVSEGDNLETNHTFWHTFFFYTASQRENVIKEIVELGFEAIEASIDEDIDARYVLTATSSGKATAEAVNAMTQTLTNVAQKYRGFYDGWTTTLTGE